MLQKLQKSDKVLHNDYLIPPNTALATDLVLDTP